jgi:hypothetical protein
MRFQSIQNSGSKKYAKVRLNWDCSRFSVDIFDGMKKWKDFKWLFLLCKSNQIIAVWGLTVCFMFSV